MNKHKKISLHTDGGARGNPGPSGIGAVLSTPQNEIIDTVSEYIGETTNNKAEYQALIAGLEKAKELKAEEVEVYMDSELIVRQLRREYKVKNKDLASLFVKAYNLTLDFKKVTFTHIPREENKEADRLVNEAIDREVVSG